MTTELAVTVNVTYRPEGSGEYVVKTFENVTERRVRGDHNGDVRLFAMQQLGVSAHRIKKITSTRPPRFPGETPHTEVNYDTVLENFRLSGERVEITYDWDGPEDKKTRCYIGRSTGWLPIYLEISKSNSLGGSAISAERIVEIHGTGKFRK